jgi:hypothetical protein
MERSPDAQRKSYSDVSTVKPTSRFQWDAAGFA